jgi:hypothetical protein
VPFGQFWLHSYSNTSPHSLRPTGTSFVAHLREMVEVGQKRIALLKKSLSSQNRTTLVPQSVHCDSIRGASIDVIELAFPGVKDLKTRGERGIADLEICRCRRRANTNW